MAASRLIKQLSSQTPCSLFLACSISFSSCRLDQTLSSHPLPQKLRIFSIPHSMKRRTIGSRCIVVCYPTVGLHPYECATRHLAVFQLESRTRWKRAHQLTIKITHRGLPRCSMAAKLMVIPKMRAQPAQLQPPDDFRHNGY